MNENATPTAPSFSYADEPPSAWAETLASKRANGVSRVRVRVPWGAHETAPGIRDFSRSPRLRLERFFRAAQENGIELDLELGFSPHREMLPSWTQGAAEVQSLIPSGAWEVASDSLELVRSPSLHDMEVRNAFLEFVDELFSLVALYRTPEGPVASIHFDFGVFRHDFTVMDTKSYASLLSARYGSLALFNTRYQTTFKDFEPAASRTGTRSLVDKRPWLASFDYRWCRARLLEDVRASVLKLVNTESVEDLLSFHVPSRPLKNPDRWTIALDPVLLEIAESGEAAPMTPAGYVNGPAAAALRLWETIRTFDSDHESRIYPLPIESADGGADARKLVVLSGKYLARRSYRYLESQLELGADVLFPFAPPQYDEDLAWLDWAATHEKEKVKLGEFEFQRFAKKGGRVWCASPALVVDDSLVSRIDQMCSALDLEGEATV